MQPSDGHSQFPTSQSASTCEIVIPLPLAPLQLRGCHNRGTLRIDFSRRLPDPKPNENKTKNDRKNSFSAATMPQLFRYRPVRFSKVGKPGHGHTCVINEALIGSRLALAALATLLSLRCLLFFVGAPCLPPSPPLFKLYPFRSGVHQFIIPMTECCILGAVELL